MRKWLLTLLLLTLIGPGQTLAQDPAPVDTMWTDNFDDTATDSLGFVNVGWIRFGPDDGLTGSAVKQTPEGHFYLLAGSYSVVGAVVAETNGIPVLDLTDPVKTGQLLKQNNFSHPNQVVSFQFNLVNMRQGSIFLFATRMTQNDTTGDPFPVSDPTEQPAYVLMFDPNKSMVHIAKYEGSFAVLDPSKWTYLGSTQFDLEADIWYRAKFYLYEDKLKAKIWEGDPIDEPQDWMIAAVDTAARVSGKFSMFAILGAPPGGDEVLIDDVVVQGFGDLTPVETLSPAVPDEFELEQNYPNPFNPETVIRFSLTRPAFTSLEVYTLMGRRVRTLVWGMQQAGTYKIVFDGRDDFGAPLPSGVYFYRLTSGNQVATKKMLLMK